MELTNYIKDKLSVSINENEIFVDFTNNWGIGDKYKIQNIIDQYKSQPYCNLKAVYIFLVTDSCDSFIIPSNVKLYRTSLLKSQKNENEYILPYIWEGFDKFDPLEVTTKPIVGFCGFPGHYRKKLIDVIKRNNRITSKFILRNQFWGGKPHDSQIIKDFLDNIKSSHFNICNRGVGNFSMRFYQTLSCGRIPILLNTDILLPFEDKINWNDIIIFASTEKELVDKILTCNDIVNRQIKCREIYDTYFVGTKFLDGIFMSYLN